MPSRGLPSALAALLAVGCAPAVTPRTADLVAPGRLEADVSAALWSAGRGHVVLMKKGGPRTEGVYTGGVDLPTDWPAGIRFIPLLLGLGGAARWGVAPRFELVGNVGFQRIGAETRFAAVRERDGAPISLSFAAGGSWEVLAEGTLVKAGFDLSRHIGRIAPLLDVYLTYGRRLHTAYLTELRGEQQCIDPLPGTRCGVPMVLARSTELRLEGAIGVAIDAKRGGPITVGVSPHVVIARGSTASEGCVLDCAVGTPDTAGPTHDLGFYLVIGGHISR